jgi:D-glycero-D-manno-heptose 1,7-bisphosphate phosphatase
MLHKALFLDRDGVINKDSGYVHKINDFVFIDGIFELASYASKLGYLLVVITNQAGIGKGLYTEKDFFKLNQWMVDQFKSKNIKITKVFFSPYHMDSVIEKYKKDHNTRKPKPGMLFQAKKDLNISLRQSILIGDKVSDIRAGISASVGTNIFLVNENYDYKDLEDNTYYRINKLVEAKNFLRLASR